MHILASIPSPTRSVWHLGPFPLRAYALCIIAGILVAVLLTTRRWKERGGDPDHVWDVSAWAIVLGIIGGRLYHVVSDPELYFTAGKHPIDALKIWDGGLGIWGAIALGFGGAWIGARRRNIRIMSFADAAIPGIVFAQAIGRLGNWFNNELYGRATSLPWGLQIHDIDVGRGQAQPCSFGHIGASVCGTYQPTFLYELLWDAALGFLLLYLDRRFRLGRGNVFALYAMGYTVGRAWIEYLRIDHANHILGLRLNDWTCLIVFAAALAWFLTHGGFRSGREPSPYYGDAAADGHAVEPGEEGSDGADDAATHADSETGTSNSEAGTSNSEAGTSNSGAAGSTTSDVTPGERDPGR